MNFPARLLIFPALLISLILFGCTVTLVQPYDAELYKNTEAFYKKASTMILKGQSSSPTTPQQLAGIPPKTASDNPGHFSKFQNDYDELLVDSNALILRSLANSGSVDEIGKQTQAKIEGVIKGNVTSECDTAQQDFPSVDLTTRNYIDLKCLVAKWKKEHQGPAGASSSKQILKKANWEGREKTLFDSILAIQSAEAFKNKTIGESK
ncbi:hypothetical protein [Pseudomonas sp.]|uniref:hypothetical protein n=1 Tax=Pseudomonas sp. TaxID=306 RepID=UPI003D6E3891